MCPAEAVGGGAHVSCAHVAAAWRRTRLALALYAPLSLAHLSALEFFTLVPVPDPPLSRFSSRWCVTRTPPCRANPTPSFLLYPHSKLVWGGAPW
jgi:hypothetical protein